MLVWHGGEPLLHPAAYVRDVLDLQQEVLGAGAPDGAPGAGAVRNAVQTNATRDGATLSLMVASGFIVSVSADFASGVRVEAGGRETDARVRANMGRLGHDGARWGVALVLGRHNRDRLEAVYDEIEAMGASWLRVNPMFAPPPAAPGGDLLLAPEAVVGALARLFVHWMEREARVPVHPLRRVLRTALRRRSGTLPPAERPPERGPGRHVRLVVHPDGTLTEQAGTAVPSAPLGNVLRQRMAEIVRSAGWPAGGRRGEALRARHCARCAYHGACDGRPLSEHPHPLPAGPCPVEAALCAWVEDYLTREGIVAVDDALLAALPAG